MPERAEGGFWPSSLGAAASEAVEAGSVEAGSVCGSSGFLVSAAWSDIFPLLFFVFQIKVR